MERNKIAENLIKIRGKRTREEMATLLGVTVSAIQMYENGARIPRDETKKKYSEISQQSIDSIFFEI